MLEALPKGVPLAYSTVLTTLRILEHKGYLKHRKEGRAFIYLPVVDRDRDRERAVTRLVQRFFGGSPERLMLNLVERRRVDPETLSRLRKRIEEEET